MCGMKHAGAASLDRLEELLGKLRQIGALKEKSRGVFYWRSKAALHFHEDPAGLFADLRVGDEWERMVVNTGAERAALVRRVGAAWMVPVATPHPGPLPQGERGKK
jgi:hypothetical protein